MSTLRLTNLQHTDASDPNIVLANDRTAALADGTASAPALSFQDDLDTGLYSPGANSIALGVGGSAILTIASTGNTTFTGAITTTSLSAQSTATNSWFQTGTNLGGTDYVWAAKDTSANVWHTGLQTDGDLYIGGNLTTSNRIGLTGSTGAAFFASQNLDIESTGRLTIKRTTHSPAYGEEAFRILDRNSSNVERVSMYADGKAVFGNASGSYVQLAQNSGITINDGAIDLYQETQTATAKPFKVQSDVGGSSGDKIEKFVILADGRTGIGTSSPEEILHVAAASEAVGNRDGVMFQSTSALAADTGLPLVFTSHIGTQANYGVASIAGRKENATSGQAGGYLQFATGNAAGAITEKVRILSSGGITFNGDTATANALDDYEEGTFTPIVAAGVDDGSGGAVPYSIQAGRYTKIGNKVYAEIYIRFATGATSTTAHARIGGLPFNMSNLSYGTIGASELTRGGGTSSFHNTTNEITTNYGTPNTANFYLYHQGGNNFYFGGGDNVNLTGMYWIGTFTYPTDA